MATAYAALVSLMNVLDRIQHPLSPACFNKSQIQSLFDKVSFLVDVLESYSHKLSKDLEQKMIASAFAAEESVESYLVAIQTPTSNGEETSRPLFPKDLDDTLQEMDCIVQEAVQAKEQNGEQDHAQLTRSSVPVGSTPMPRGNSVEMVGFDEEMKQLMSRITARESTRHIIPIVGMGGLGKTTFAKNVYDHPHINRQFDVKAWVTISQVYTTRSLLVPLLHCIGIDKTDEIKDADLGVYLHKGLWGRRYLIIIDDVWDVKAWDEISRFCVEQNNGSRILLTTRLLNVALSVGSCSPFELQLLNADRSWDLLSKRVFGQDTCPDELKHHGKEIARKCKGLPLAIVVIGGLLNVSSRTQENWEFIERNINSIISVEDDEHCMKILSLSYHQLPIHLKPCFLYMATFPEDHEIRVSEVTKLWSADGFLKPVDGKALVDVALECLSGLIDRNLIIVKKRKVRGEIKCLILHDLVRDMCIREAQREMFLYVHNGLSELPSTLGSHRRFVAHAKGMSYLENPRSFIGFGPHLILRPEFSLSSSSLRIFSYPYMIDPAKYLKQFVNLRFLKLATGDIIFFDSITLLSNLETLIDPVEGSSGLPSGIWELRYLKHVVCSSVVEFPSPPDANEVVLSNLETLSNVLIRSDDMLHRIPKVKKLNVWYLHFTSKEQVPPLMLRFDHCHKLEKLKFSTFGCLRLGNNTFPSNLRKLTLGHTEFQWESMTIVGSLPNLESLVLLENSFSGIEWETIEGEFQSLKCLSIRDSDLVRWTVEECSHFPCLEHLSLHNMMKLEELPQVFAELMTLASIKLVGCPASSVISAKQILDERKAWGNHDLTVEVSLPKSIKVKLDAELDGFTDDNFRLQTHEHYI